MSKPILIYSANGVQGNAVVREAIRRGHRVRALVRTAAKSAPLKDLGADVAVADLQDAVGLREAHAGIDYAILQIPIGVPSQMEPLIANAAAAIQINGLKGVIVKTGAGKPAVENDVPAFVLNQIIEDKLRRTGVPFSVVRPTMYLENFLRPDGREEIRQNNRISYSLPSHRKIAWTCIGDIAAAALSLLENKTFGADCSISGPEAVDGDGLAVIFSAALQRNIQFQHLPLQTFEQNIDPASSYAAARRLAAATIRFIAENPEVVTGFLSRPFRAELPLAEFQPTSIAAWAGERVGLFARS